MEQFLGHLVHFAIWVFFVMFGFAAVGVYATVRWIAALVAGGERVVQDGTRQVEGVFRRR